MKTAAKICIVGIYLASVAVLGFFTSGCAGLGRIGQAAVGVVAPEYKATADNLYQLLKDDQLAASLEVEVVLVDKEDKIYRKGDLDPVVLTSRRAYTWDSLPRGAWERFLGDAKAPPADLAAQKQAFADALKSISTSPAKKD